jgi:hypothetical protein
MSENNPKFTTPPTSFVALLCVSDVGTADGDTPLALAPLYGQPFIHHLIKSLENLGITRFFIGISTVPGALLTYSDSAKQQGLDIYFVRNPSDLAAQITDDVRIVVQSADTIWEQALVGSAMATNQPLVATIDEQAENQCFERIDLNHRWGGLAILDRCSVAALTALPDGWDMGSALLRQALQDGAAQWPVAQKNMQAGLIRKLSKASELPAAMAMFAQPDDDQPNSLDKMVFAPMVKRVLPYIWSTSWSRPLAEWLFPGLALCCAALACLSLPMAAAVLGMAAIFCWWAKKQVWALEYRSGQTDWLGTAGWSLLALGLAATVVGSASSPSEGAFVAATMVALSMFAKRFWKTTSFWISSPFIIAILVTAGGFADVTAWSIRLLILAELALLLVSQLKSGAAKT